MRYNKFEKGNPNEEEFIKSNFSGCSPVALAIVMIFFFVLTVVCSCTTTKYIPVESIRTEYKEKLQRDSIYLKDSIYIREKGDTVFFTKYSTKYVERLRVDSFSKIDSIQVPYPVEVIKKVEKSLTWWQSIKMELGGFSMGILIILLAFLVYKVVRNVKSFGWKGLLNLIK